MDLEKLRRITEEAKKQRPAIEERQRQEATEKYRQEIEKDHQEKIKRITSLAESAAQRGDDYCYVTKSHGPEEEIVLASYLPIQVREAGMSAIITNEAEMQFLPNEAKKYVKYSKELGLRPLVEVKNIRETSGPNERGYYYREIEWRLTLTWSMEGASEYEKARGTENNKKNAETIKKNIDRLQHDIEVAAKSKNREYADTVKGFGCTLLVLLAIVVVVIGINSRTINTDSAIGIAFLITLGIFVIVIGLRSAIPTKYDEEIKSGERKIEELKQQLPK